MAKSAVSGKVQTVLGVLAPDAMGITLPHEHLLIDISCIFTEPRAAGEKGLAYRPVSLENPAEILETLRREGGDLSRTIMCHFDRTVTEFGQLLDLAATGCYLEYDLFGLESSYYPFNPAFDMPSDGQRGWIR